MYEKTVAEAKDVGRQWVRDVASHLPGFAGAYFAGSINWMPDGDSFPSTSDIDISVVFDRPGPSQEPGKLEYEDMLLDPGRILLTRFEVVDDLLGDYRLVGSFWKKGVIVDPTGRLTQVQQYVVSEFTRRDWVHRRCDDAISNCLKYLDRLSKFDPYYTQVTCWLFAEGIMTHVLLAAGLRNPTVRRRYADARVLMEGRGRSDIYENLLRMLGCAELTSERVRRHLANMTLVFDRAKSAVRSAFPFASDISDLARPVAVNGSEELIERGEHREAVFWIVATFARCMAILDQDAPKETLKEAEPAFWSLMADLGIASFADMELRAAQVRDGLPELKLIAHDLIAADPEIRD